MQTVSKAAHAEIEIKKSRFIGDLCPCMSEAAALEFVRKLRSEHPSANHVVFAWRIRDAQGQILERANDDGEPSGTAGRPVLAVLDGQEIINAAVAVVRYFGGTKLGTGGLARAYAQAAKAALDKTNIEPWVEMKTLKLRLDYSNLQLLEYQLKEHSGRIIEKQFGTEVELDVEVPASKAPFFESHYC